LQPAGRHGKTRSVPGSRHWRRMLRT
jgi:hypothetical protein